MLSGCTGSTLSGYGGALSPAGLVVKSGVAFVANDVSSGNSNCLVVRCTNAAAMSGCSCVSGTGILANAEGVALSPDGSKLYLTGTTSYVPLSLTAIPGIVVCSLSGATVGSCTAYSFSGRSLLTGLYATSSNVYTFTPTSAGALTSNVLVCDADAPAAASCSTGLTVGTGLLTGAGNTPWRLAMFDGLTYVPGNQNIQRCTNATASGSCTALGLVGLLPNLLATEAGANSIFVYPRI